jgi:hypothetical protein
MMLSASALIARIKVARLTPMRCCNSLARMPPQVFRMGKASMGIVVNLFETIHGPSLYRRISCFSTLNETIDETIYYVASDGPKA